MEVKAEGDTPDGVIWISSSRLTPQTPIATPIAICKYRTISAAIFETRIFSPDVFLFTRGHFRKACSFRSLSLARGVP